MHYAINDNFSLTALENKGEVTREKREQTNEQQQKKRALLSLLLRHPTSEILSLVRKLIIWRLLTQFSFKY